MAQKQRRIPVRDNPNRDRIPVSLTLSRDVVARIDTICAEEQRPRSQIMEWAALRYADEHEKATA